MAFHALQAVSPLGTFAGVTAPVTLSASVGGKVQVILLSTAVVLALPEEQDLGCISARRAAGGRVAAPALAAARSAGVTVIPVVAQGAEWSTRARVGQHQAGTAGRTGQGTLASAALTGRVAPFAGSMLGVVSRGAVGQAAIPQQQVPPVLALEAHAAAVPQVGHAPLAQGVAVHTVAHQVEVLLLLAACPALATIQSGMGVAG